MKNNRIGLEGRMKDDQRRAVNKRGEKAEQGRGPRPQVLGMIKFARWGVKIKWGLERKDEERVIGGVAHSSGDKGRLGPAQKQRSPGGHSL